MNDIRELLRIGLVGPGRIARELHLPNLRACPGVVLEAVAGSSPESAGRAADELGFRRALPDWRSLVADPDVDAVVVATWPFLHAPVTLAALEAGKHVLCQARMAMDAAEAERMQEASRTRPDLVAMLVPSPITAWSDAAVKRVLGSGLLGELRTLRVVFDNPGPPDPNEHWREQRRSSGVNTMALGIVYEAVARWVGDALAVQALQHTFLDEKPAPGGPIRPDVPDHLALLVELPGPIMSSWEISNHGRIPGEGTASLFGTEGTLRVDLRARRLELVRGDGSREEVGPRPDEVVPLAPEREWIAAIRGEGEVRWTDFETGLRYMRFTEAAVRAAESGERVRIDH